MKIVLSVNTAKKMFFAALLLLPTFAVVNASTLKGAALDQIVSAGDSYVVTDAVGDVIVLPDGLKVTLTKGTIYVITKSESGEYKFILSAGSVRLSDSVGSTTPVSFDIGKTVITSTGAGMVVGVGADGSATLARTAEGGTIRINEVDTQFAVNSGGTVSSGGVYTENKAVAASLIASTTPFVEGRVLDDRGAEQSPN
jgi:hypothetical protein